jgi:uncharacterized membrane protein YcjF (UPF0283 family)
MSSPLKRILGILISVATAAFTGWLVKAAYDGASFRLPGILLGVSVLAQVALNLAPTDEEKELRKLQGRVEEMQKERDIWYGVELSKTQRTLAIVRQQIVQIESGNARGFREWSEVEKSL